MSTTSRDLIHLQRVGALLRRLPNGFPGKMRAARFLLGTALQARDVELTDRNGNWFLLPHMSEPMTLHLLTDGVYEAGTLNFILGHLGETDYFLDVGANIGLFTLPAARKTRGGGVIAIEASPSLFRYLQTNVEHGSLTNVQPFCVAASDHTQAAVPFYNAPIDRFGMGSLAPQFSGESISVPAETLDNLLTPAQTARVTTIKIDVEGFEAAVLKGATRLLTRPQPPLVVFEFIDWAEARAGQVGASQRVLLDYGFRIWRLEEYQRGGPPLHSILTQGNAMLVAQKQ